MTVQIHYCPSRGTAQSGDELDCPKCRAELLKAFQSPADVPEVPPAPRGWFAPSRLPHPVEHASPPRFEPDEFETSPAKPADSGPVPLVDGPLTRFGFTVAVEARASGTTGRGSWAVTCSCGWLEHGTFTEPNEIHMRRASAIGLGLEHLTGHAPPAGPVPGAHVTRVMTAPYARNIPGGNWYAGCTCGWTATGIWTGGKTEEWAAGQAAAAAEAHKEGLQDQ
jgi:hypothetical protein